MGLYPKVAIGVAVLGVALYFGRKTPIGQQILSAYPWNGMSATPNIVSAPFPVPSV
jgi:hypothetical protein